MKNISIDGLCELASYEALSTSLYLDSVGVRTIGLGSTISDIPDIASWPWTKTITIQEACDLYKKSLVKYVAAVNKALNVTVTQGQFDALVCFAYNVGTSGMSNSSLVKYINNGDSDIKIRAGFMAWNKGTIGGKKVVIKGLTNRRNAEANLYIQGIYVSDGTILHFPVGGVGHTPQYKNSVKVDIKPYL